MRTIIVGIAPARVGDEGQPLSAIAKQSTGRKIADMLEIKPLDYMRSFDRVNVCPFARPSTISPREWIPAAENLAGSLLRGRRVILLGSNVAECFGVPRSAYNYLQWREFNSTGHRGYIGVAGFRAERMGLPFSWAVLPHPSGRNRWYNDEENKMSAKLFLVNELLRSQDELK